MNTTASLHDPVVSAWADGDIWDCEYGLVRAIPSSLRCQPSRAFRRLECIIKPEAGLRVLDVGAGPGRHSIYLSGLGALVHAVDASAVATEIHRDRAAAGRMPTFVEHVAMDETNLPDGRYDIILDSYVSCHILSATSRQSFLDSLLTRLTPGGRLYTAGMGTRDSYYRCHLVSDGEPIAVDPLNGIAKRLQSTSDAAMDGVVLGKLLGHTTERFVDVVGTTVELREVHAAVLTR